MATKTATTTEVEETQDVAPEGPVIDSMGAAIKKMVAKGKEQGFITCDELNAALTQAQSSSEQIEDTMTMLSEMGINVVDGEDSEESSNQVATTNGAATPPATTKKADDEDFGRTDDPVRMYLREMGSVELLSREGEIEIAKRIEAGREKMSGGICESPLTLQAILEWRDALRDDVLLLRDVIDLDATYGGGPDAVNKNAAAKAEAGNGADASEKPEAGNGADASEKAKAEAGNGADTENKDSGDDEEDDDEDPGLSLAAMEEKLKPQVLAGFDTIAKTYKRLQKLQETRLTATRRGQA
ncbi:MAG: RNA polymerase sigma factor region1.1 domain-containing protein, partial [Alphaproteobacteria bacterium]